MTLKHIDGGLKWRENNKLCYNSIYVSLQNIKLIRVFFITFYKQIKQLMVASCILGSISTHVFPTHHGYGYPGMIRLLTFSLNRAYSKV